MECKYCQCKNIVKAGKTITGKQWFLCKDCNRHQVKIDGRKGRIVNKTLKDKNINIKYLVKKLERKYRIIAYNKALMWREKLERFEKENQQYIKNDIKDIKDVKKKNKQWKKRKKELKLALFNDFIYKSEKKYPNFPKEKYLFYRKNRIKKIQEDLKNQYGVITCISNIYKILDE